MARKKKNTNSDEGGGSGGGSSHVGNGDVNVNQNHPSTSEQNVHSKSQQNIHPKFLEAQAKFKNVIKQNLEKNEYLSSSDEDEIEPDAMSTIMGKLIESYKKTGGEITGLEKTNKYLDDAFISGAAVCLICIASIKRSDAIWSCKGCYCFFHLTCIQRWGRDNIAQKRIHHDELLIDVVPPPLTFACPKCRTEYSEKEVPHQYFCFCGAKKDPAFEPWLVPHSCGEHCHKDLIPSCGHICLLLCHPGPCPPCPKMVKTSCQCGQNSQLQRCSNKEWTCKSICNRVLLCGVHKCKLNCHNGSCQPCPKQAKQPCLCQSEEKVRPCSQPQWQCEKVCSNLLSCGIHKCEKICHGAPCPPCSLAEIRGCPCGKKKYTLPCTEDTPSCGDTCEKLLDCGAHYCNMRCHKSKCGQCLETITKRCRCGIKMKEVPCAKEFICETKCKKIRNCYIHPCNRKCCNGNCPPCEKPCGKTLSCGNHKCNQLCHVGPCYPCTQTDKVSCRCGNRSLTVSCGAKRKTKPPKCRNRCSIKPDCGHTNSIPHNCHFGSCPPCTQLCGKKFSCLHSCPMKCHKNVLVNLSANIKPAGPWEKIEPQLVKKSFPCEPCKAPVDIKCYGKHSIRILPCHSAKPFACKSFCGFTLSCGNHKCRLPCHVIQHPPNDKSVSLNCHACDSQCTRPRPAGCNHSCQRSCHQDPCPPCTLKFKMKCHCTMNFVYIPCLQWSSANPQEKSDILRCLVRCPKTYPCGHLCAYRCHAGPCPNPDKCQESVKVKCPCKRIVKELPCSDVVRGIAQVECNLQCDKLKEQVKKIREEEEEKKKKEEELKLQQELELYQRKFQKGRNKKQKEPKNHQKKEKTFWEKYSSQIITALGFAFFISMMSYIVITNLDDK